jgi:predicted acylesterase/phospholipase RssA
MNIQSSVGQPKLSLIIPRKVLELRQKESGNPQKVTDIDYNGHAGRLETATKNWKGVLDKNRGMVDQSKRFFNLDPTLVSEKKVAVKALQEFLQEHTIESTLHQPVNKADSIIENGQKILTEIIDGILLPTKPIKSAKEFKQALIKANHVALDKTLEFRKDLIEKQFTELQKRKVDLSPQILGFKNGTDPVSGKPVRMIKVVMPAHTKTELVISGGGGKGAKMMELASILSKYGFTDNIKGICGTSAGALGAVLLAFKEPEKACEFLKQNPIAKLVKNVDGVKFEKLYPDLKFPNLNNKQRILGKLITGVAPNKKAEAALYELDMYSARSVKDYLMVNSNHQNFKIEFDQLEESEKNRLEDLIKVDIDDKEKSRKGNSITFNDLKILSKIDSKTFTPIEITAFDMKTQEIVYLNADTQPNMPICYAARASMALPPVFRPIELEIDVKEVINGKECVSRKKVLLADGGFGSNTPIKIFRENPEGENSTLTNENVPSKQNNYNEFSRTKPQEQILTLIFEALGYSHNVLHKRYDPDKEGSDDRDFWAKPGEIASMKTYAGFVGLDPIKHIDNANKDAANIHKNGPKTFVMHHGRPELGGAGLDTLTLDPTSEQLDIAGKSGEVKLMEQLLPQEVKGAATIVWFRNVNELYDEMTEEQKEAVINAPPKENSNLAVTSKKPPEDAQANSIEIDEDSSKENENPLEIDSEVINDTYQELYLRCIEGRDIKQLQAQVSRPLLNPPEPKSLTSSGTTLPLSPKNTSEQSITVSNVDNINPVSIQTTHSPEGQTKTSAHARLEYLQTIIKNRLKNTYTYLLNAKLTKHKTDTVLINNAENYATKQIEALRIKQSNCTNLINLLRNNLLQEAREIAAHQDLLVASDCEYDELKKELHATDHPDKQAIISFIESKLSELSDKKHLKVDGLSHEGKLDRYEEIAKEINEQIVIQDQIQNNAFQNAIRV